MIGTVFLWLCWLGLMFNDFTGPHHGILAGFRQQAIIAWIVTIALAFIFTAFQGYQYWETPFTIADDIYGSTFYLATGFHGFDVMIGTVFLLVFFLLYISLYLFVFVSIC